MSLRRRLTLVLCALVLLPLLTGGAMVALVVPRAQTQAADDRLVTTARGAGAVLARHCAELGEAARAIALETSPLLGSGQPGSTEAVTVALAVAMRPLPGVSAAVLGQDGAVLATAGPRDDVAGSAGQSCASGELGSPRPSLVQSVPVGDAGAVVLSSPLDAGALSAFRAELGLRSDLVLVAGTDVVAATIPAVTAGQVASRLGGESGGPVEVAGFRALADGADRGLGVRMIAAEPASKDLVLLVGELALLLVVAVGSTVTATVLARRLTGPLVDLTAVAGRLGSGDLAARTPISGTDEVGRLGTAFNEMADQLVTTIVSARQGRAALDESFEHFGRALGRTHDLEPLVRTLLDACRTASGAQTGGAWLVEASGHLKPLTTPPRHGEALAELARRVVDGEGHVVSTVGNPPVDALAYPLLHEQEVLGAVIVAEPLGGAFTPEGHAALLALSRQAGTAVHNVRTHQETERLSVTDPLTGAGNFRHLSTTLAREVERAQRFDRPLAVLMLDLDHFKAVNDTHGHARGDAVLRELARRLRECVRDVDTVARYGGEEFALVLPETDVSGADMVAGRVVDAVGREPFLSSDGPPLTITVSVGLAGFPADGQTAGGVLRAADAALYVAKRSGRDQWHRATHGGRDLPREDTVHPG